MQKVIKFQSKSSLLKLLKCSDIQAFKNDLNDKKNLLHNLREEHPVENTAGQPPAKTSPINNEVTVNLEPKSSDGQFPAKKHAISAPSSSTKEVFIPPHRANKSVHVQNSKSEDIFQIPETMNPGHVVKTYTFTDIMVSSVYSKIDDEKGLVHRNIDELCHIVPLLEKDCKDHLESSRNSKIQLETVKCAIENGVKTLNYLNFRKQR